MAVIHDGSDFACPKCRQVLARRRKRAARKKEIERLKRGDELAVELDGEAAYEDDEEAKKKHPVQGVSEDLLRAYERFAQHGEAEYRGRRLVQVGSRVKVYRPGSSAPETTVDEFAAAVRFVDGDGAVVPAGRRRVGRRRERRVAVAARARDASRVEASPAADRDASPVAGADDYGRALAAQMLESLLGNPHTVFTSEGHGKGYRYLRVRSQNADWYQGFEGDKAKLRAAIVRQARGLPLNLKRAEDRWLHDETERARVEGWGATFDGKASPIAIEPEEKRDRLGLKLARLVVRPKPLRLFLAMPEADVRRVRARSDDLHETPNLYLNHVIVDHLDRSDAADEKPETPF